MKRAAKFIAVIIVVILIVEVASYFFQRSHSREIASQMVLDDIKRQGYDTHQLTGPTDGRVGNAAVSYSWDYHDKTHHYEYLVWFGHFYEPTLSIWDYDRKD